MRRRADLWYRQPDTPGNLKEEGWKQRFQRKGDAMQYVVRIAGIIGLTVSLTSTLWATKLVTYSHRGEARLGAYEDNSVIDLNRAYALMLRERGTPRAEARAAALVPPNMLEFLQGEEESSSPSSRRREREGWSGSRKKASGSQKTK
jgi:hypothetical protein